jgi:hypothetical protein
MLAAFQVRVSIAETDSDRDWERVLLNIAQTAVDDGEAGYTVAAGRIGVEEVAGSC